jgi:hypothetical protein
VESLLILLAIIALQYGAEWLKKRAQKKRENPTDDEEYSENESAESEEAPSGPSPSLEDLIRKFQEEQAKNGNAEETVPEEDEDLEEDEDFEDDEDLDREPAEEPLPEYSAKPVFEKKEPLPEPSPVQALTPAASLKTEARDDAAKPLPEPEKKISANVPPKVSAVKTMPLDGRPNFEFSMREARKGFLWAKVLDDPRFRRRSPVPFSSPR